MSDSSTNKEIVRRAYEALTSGNVRGFLEVLDENVEVREPDGLPHGGSYIGLDSHITGSSRSGSRVTRSPGS